MTSLNSVAQESLLAGNEEYRKLHQEHQELEAKLESFESMKDLGTEDDLHRKQLQKLKLSGKDRIEEVLRKYRKN